MKHALSSRAPSLPKIPLLMLTASLLCVGCGKEAPSGEKKNTRGLRDAPCTKTTAQEIKAYLGGFCAQPHDIQTPGDMELVAAGAARLDAQPIEAPILIQITAEETSLLNRSPLDRATIREAAERSRARLSSPEAPLNAVLLVSKDAPTARVMAALRVVQDADIKRISFAVAGGGTTSALSPSAEAARARIMKLPPDQRSAQLAQKIATLVEGCKPLTRVFEAVTMLPPDKRCEVLAQGIGEGYVECGCALNLIELQDHITPFMEEPAAKTVSMSFDHKSGAIISLGEGPWAEHAPALFKHVGGTIWIGERPPQ